MEKGKKLQMQLNGRNFAITIEEHIHGPVYRVRQNALCLNQLPFLPLLHLWQKCDLPQVFVLKIFDEISRLEDERMALTRLRPIQGKFVPRLYGTAEINAASGSRKQAIALQYLCGHYPWESYLYEKAAIASGIYDCFEQVSRYGVVHNDVKLDNLIVIRESRGRWRTFATIGVLILGIGSAIVNTHNIVFMVVLFILVCCRTLLRRGIPRPRVFLLDFEWVELDVDNCLMLNLGSARNMAEDLEVDWSDIVRKKEAEHRVSIREFQEHEKLWIEREQKEGRVQ